MKAIETIYAGHRFRSRLEARWAVLFDHIGYAWQYEPEGFELNAGRYLPDFYLPDYDKWVEVKGAWRMVTQRDWRRWAEFAKNQWDNTSRFVVLVGDIPRERAMAQVTYSEIAPGVIPVDEELVRDHGRDAAGFIRTTWVPNCTPSRFVAACGKARSARFA